MTKVLNLTSNVMALTNFLLNGTAYYGLGLAAAAFCCRKLHWFQAWW